MSDSAENGGPEPPKESRGLWVVARWVGGGGLALVGLLVAANTLKESRIQAQRTFGQEAFYQLLGNLASENPVVREAAIGQIQTVIVTRIPATDKGALWSGVPFLLGFNRPRAYPYHEDLLQLIHGLARQDLDRGGGDASALISMLCKLGSQGWYLAEQRSVTSRERCLEWIWQNAPRHRVSDTPSYSLFGGADLSGVDFGTYYMERAFFENARIRRASFSESRLDSAVFRGATFDSVQFVNADLDDADFSGATLTHVSFISADLAGADFRGAHLNDVSFADADLSGVAFQNAVFRRTDPSSARRIEGVTGWVKHTANGRGR